RRGSLLRKRDCRRKPAGIEKNEYDETKNIRCRIAVHRYSPFISVGPIGRPIICTPLSGLLVAIGRFPHALLIKLELKRTSFEPLRIGGWLRPSSRSA